VTKTTDIQVKTLYASLFEVQRGLFQINYRADFMQQEKFYLPPYQAGACASDVREQIEHMARAQGYEAIVWDPEIPSACVSVLPAVAISRPTRFQT
jgi:hypothetical protein